MASNIKVGRQSLSTAAAGNTQDFTISGFGTPVAAIFILSGGTTDDTIANNASTGIGFTDGVTDTCTYIGEYNATGANTARIQTTAGVIVTTNFSGSTVNGSFSFNSFITDGVRLNIDTQCTTAHLVTFVLIGGSDISNVHVGQKDDLGVGTSAVDINTVGFEPDLVLITSNCNTSTAVATNAMLSFGVGINDGFDTQRVALFGAVDSNGASVVNTYLGNDSVVGQVWNDSLGWDGVIGSYDASGFSITPNASAGSDIISYLAIKWSVATSLSLFDLTIPTSGSYAETTPAFEPLFGLIVTEEGPTVRNTLTDGSGTLGISVFDGTSIYTTSHTDDDAQNPAVCKSLSSDQFRLLNSDGSTDDALASSYAFDAAGWDFTLSTNPASALFGWGLAIESVSADVTAPVLSSPTGSPTGSTTASGTVSTDEGNGTLYFYASTNSSELAATIKASGSSQAVSGTGSQAVSFTGLTANTTYYAHYVHDDASSNESNVVSSTSFKTGITISNVYWDAPTGWDYAVYDGGTIPSDSVMFYDTGIDDTSAAAAFLTDSSASWTINEWVGFRVVNVTDGSSGVITANTATTITATLSGGVGNNWDSGDVYNIVIDAAVNDQIVYEEATSLGGTVSAMSTKGVPTITGASGTHTFDVKYRDVTDSKVSSIVTVTVTV